MVDPVLYHIVVRVLVYATWFCQKLRYPFLVPYLFAILFIDADNHIFLVIIAGTFLIILSLVIVLDADFHVHFLFIEPHSHNIPGFYVVDTCVGCYACVQTFSRPCGTAVLIFNNLFGFSGFGIVPDQTVISGKIHIFAIYSYDRIAFTIILSRTKTPRRVDTGCNFFLFAGLQV